LLFGRSGSARRIASFPDHLSQILQADENDSTPGWESRLYLWKRKLNVSNCVSFFRGDVRSVSLSSKRKSLKAMPNRHIADRKMLERTPLSQNWIVPASEELTAEQKAELEKLRQHAASERERAVREGRNILVERGFMNPDGTLKPAYRS
jgi:hypothetical protein